MKEVKIESLRMGDIVKIVNEPRGDLFIGRINRDLNCDFNKWDCVIELIYDFKKKIISREVQFIRGDIIYKLTKEDLMIEML